MVSYDVLGIGSLLEEQLCYGLDREDSSDRPTFLSGRKLTGHKKVSTSDQSAVVM